MANNMECNVCKIKQELIEKFKNENNEFYGKLKIIRTELLKILNYFDGVKVTHKGGNIWVIEWDDDE